MGSNHAVGVHFLIEYTGAKYFIDAFLLISYIVKLTSMPLIFKVNAFIFKVDGDLASVEGDNASVEGDNASVEDDNASVEDDNASVEDDNASVEDDNASVEDDFFEQFETRLSGFMQVTRIYQLL